VTGCGDGAQQGLQRERRDGAHQVKVKRAGGEPRSGRRGSVMVVVISEGREPQVGGPAQESNTRIGSRAGQCRGCTRKLRSVGSGVEAGAAMAKGRRKERRARKIIGLAVTLATSDEWKRGASGVEGLQQRCTGCTARRRPGQSEGTYL
jgi:hypothetical protein